MELVVRFSAQNKPASMIIRFFRWIPHSHVEILMSNNRTLGARLIGGVAVRPPTEYAYYEDICVNVPEALWIEALNLRGTPYDILGLFSFLLRIGMQVSRWFTCVEFVAGLLKKHGVIDIPNEHRIDPFQLYLILLNLNKGRKECSKLVAGV
jgi:hypothetical protein